ncbi:MAG: hypothetical protein AAGB12_00420 [Pseudomonadota bacterium]
MFLQRRKISFSIATLLVFIVPCNKQSFAAHTDIAGILDFRLHTTQGIESYLSGSWGKFRYDNGTGISLAQATLDINTDWTEHWSTHWVLNGYYQENTQGLGLNEGYIRYISLPTENGLRTTFNAGIHYPNISMNNQGIGWQSPQTLSFSAINSWIGSEVRHIGFSIDLEWLGKFRNQPYDWGLGLEIFNHNDTTGAVLAWHGWNISSYQTPWQDSIPLPPMQTRAPGEILENQAPATDPFKEIDYRVGYHFIGQWKYKKNYHVKLGHYDNRALPYIVKYGHYAWHTRFTHVGFQSRPSRHWQWVLQALWGDTLMQSPQRFDVVNNTFSSAFLLGSYRWLKHLFSARLDIFDVDDRDNTFGDNNNEQGYAVTINSQYRFSKQWRFHIEYNHISSKKPVREIYTGKIKERENQWQIAFQYFFEHSFNNDKYR